MGISTCSASQVCRHLLNSESVKGELEMNCARKTRSCLPCRSLSPTLVRCFITLYTLAVSQTSMISAILYTGTFLSWLWPIPIRTKQPTTVFLKIGRWTNLSSLNLDSLIFSRSSRFSIVFAFLTIFFDLCLSVSDSPEEMLDTEDELELEDEDRLRSSSPPELELE